MQSAHYIYQNGADDVILKEPFKAGYPFEGWYKDRTFTQQVKEIAAGSRENFRLYAKWGKRDGFYAANPSCRFKSLNDMEIYSKADGRPKLLVFYDDAEADNASTVGNITGIIDALGWADIYAIDLNENASDKEKVRQFAAAYGCDGITFTYRTAAGNADMLSMQEYLEVAGIETSTAVLPVTCYIDEGDYFQWISQGTASAEDILGNLEKYCGYSHQDDGIYKITYKLDGGTNNMWNPASYTPGTASIVLKDPSRLGFTFEGWYEDSDFQGKITEIAAGREGDITLYAKWIRRMSTENPDYTFTTLDDETASSRADGKPKVLLFFRQSSSMCQKTSQDLSQHIENFNGVDIYAIEAAKATRELVVQFKNDYGCDEITYCYDTGETNMRCFYDYVDIAQFSDGAGVPFIVYIDSQNCVQHADLGQRSYTEILTDLRDYCGYRYEDSEGTYKITYELNGGTNDSANPSTYTSETETITLKDAVKDGYTFEGWYKDAEFNEQVTQIDKGSAGDITLYARWSVAGIPNDPDEPDDREPGTYKVTFDVQGHGTAPQTLESIKAGVMIDSPEEPTAEGYRFDGWYKDTACTKAWDFGTDTVQSDLTLYAKWFGIGSDGEFAVQEIADVYYTGKAQKPAVSVYDENTLLKAGKDYTIKYYNYINANKNSELKGEEFNPALPYVEIIGKGNYKETVKINFNIQKAPIGENFNSAAGVSLKVNDQLVKANKPQKPFGSLKYARNLKEGTDYELELRALFANDGFGKPVLETNPYSDAKVPANYTGQFMLTVTGIGNYTGSISRMVYVADKAHLMKNVKITLGKDLKNIPYTGSGIELKAAEKLKPANDEFVVTYGSTVLKPDEDYYVYYNNNVGVGKAEIVVTGTNGYVGKKTATFNIKGKAFTNGTVTVTGLLDQAYTGRAIVQNENAVLTWNTDGTKLVYGRDYTVSYSKNINKCTTTITFTGKAEAGYSGKISKKFKISAADISRAARAESMNAITVPYTKAGVRPVDEIRLVAVIKEKEGSAYTLQGEIEVPLQIYMEKLTKSNLEVKIDPAVYIGGQVRPKVTVKYTGDGGSTSLEEGVDYTLVYGVNTASGKNKGSVTVKSLAPRYGGSVTYKFEIIRKDLKYWLLPVINEK